MPRILCILLVSVTMAMSACAFRQKAPQGEAEAAGHDALPGSATVAVVDEAYLGARAVPLGKNGEPAPGAAIDAQAETAPGEGAAQDSDMDAQLAAALGLGEESL